MPDFSKFRFENYRFNPQPDITAYELATLMNFIIPGGGDKDKLFKLLDTKWTRAMDRHVEKTYPDQDYDDFRTAVIKELERRKQND